MGAVALSACLNAQRTNVIGSAGSPMTSVPAAAANPGRASARTLMIESATAMLGQPYRWGGSQPGGFDCSGLVTYAAAAAGIHVPRTAQQLRNFGSPIARRHLLPGDLVFLHLEHKELHVAIAMDGEHFIHAPSRGGRVRIDSLTAPPYDGAFLEARRFIENR